MANVRWGGYIVLGTYSGDGTLIISSLILIKTDSLGNEIWRKDGIIDFGLLFSWPNKMKLTSDGGIIIIGSNSNGGTTHDIFLMKTDGFGNQEWIQNYDSLQSAPLFGSHEKGYDVMQTNDGGYIFTGIAGSLGVGNGELIIIRTDSLGNELWTKKDTGLADAVGKSIIGVENGNFLIFGSTTSPALSAGNETLMYLVKTDSAGNKLWGKTYNWSGGDYTDGASVKVHNNGNYLLFGTGLYIGSSIGEMLLIKTDTGGDVISQMNYKTNDFSSGIDFDFTNDDGQILVGVTKQLSNNNLDVHVVKTDSSGIKQWEKAIGGSYGDWGASIKQTDDNGFIIAGSTGSYGSGMSDIYLIKTDSLGISPPYTSIRPLSPAQVNFTIYPNPTTGQFTLQMHLQEQTRLSIKLYHFTGQLVRSEEISNVSGDYIQLIDMSNYSKGIYYLQITTNAGPITRKVVYQ